MSSFPHGPAAQARAGVDLPAQSRLGVHPRWRFGLVAGCVVCAGTSVALGDSHTDADAAVAMARATLVDLKAAGTPNELDFAAAATLLTYAHQLAPKDEDILRLLIEAEASSGSREQLMALTTELLRLAPDDTVAQLRLASGKISSQQTADKRLEAYRQFLGPKGEKVDRSVRSRLAVDGALLLRERGDLNGFAEWVTLATQLDSTNKEAATLALNFYDQRTSEDAEEGHEPDPIARLELMQNLLLADPLDEATHLAIAYELSDRGDAQGANNFFQIYSTLMDKRHRDVSTEVQASMQVNMWQRQGAKALFDVLREHVEQQRRSTQRQRQALIDAHAGEQVDPSQLPDPAQVRLPMDLERVRLAAAVAMGESGVQSEAVDYAFTEVRDTISLSQKAIHDRLEMPADKLPEGVAPLTDDQRAELTRRSRWLAGELAWMRIFAGREIDQAKQDLQTLATDPDADAAVLERMEGWLALRTGDMARAQTLLTGEGGKRGGEDWRALGAAVLAEKRQDTSGALEQYTRLAQQEPGTSVGAFARTRYNAIAGKDVPDGPGVEKLRRAASAMPVWVKAMTDAPERYMSLSVQMDKTNLDPFDKASMVVTIRNTSPIALAVGPDRTIQSRLLLVPSAQVGLNEVPTSSALEVVNLDRRLTLMPGETMTATAWPDSGSLGWMLDELAVGTARIRWRVLQGFEMGQDGYFVAAPISLTAESPSVTRVASPKAQAPTETLLAAVKQGSVRELGEALQIVRARIVRRPAQPEIISQLEETDIWAALIERWKSLDVAGKIVVLSSMPALSEAPASSAVDNAIKDETEPAVVAMMLLTRAAAADSPLLAEGRFAGQENLRLLADSCRQQIKDGVPTYAVLTSPFGVQAAGLGSGGTQGSGGQSGTGGGSKGGGGGGSGGGVGGGSIFR